MNTAASHLENASFLRELAESLPRIAPAASTPERIALLNRLANAELAEAEHNEWVKAKVTAARADTRPRLSIEEVEASLMARAESLRNGSQATRQKCAQDSR